MFTPQLALKKLRQRVQMTKTAVRADGFLVSYPKSGRTWFRFIISLYLQQTIGDHSIIDLHTMFQVMPNYDLDPIRGMPAYKYSNKQTDIPLVLVTHIEYKYLLFFKRPVIFMVRDPRDVIVSAYFHATRHKHRFQGDIEAFINDDEQGLPALIAHSNGWAEGLKQRPCLVLSYEELTKDTTDASARALRFLGLVPREAALDEAIHEARFEAMRELEVQNGLPGHDYDRDDAESLRMRRGKVGGFEDYLTAAQIDRIGRMCRERLSSDAKELLSATGMPLR